MLMNKLFTKHTINIPVEVYTKQDNNFCSFVCKYFVDDGDTHDCSWHCSLFNKQLIETVDGVNSCQECKKLIHLEEKVNEREL